MRIPSREPPEFGSPLHNKLSLSTAYRREEALQGERSPLMQQERLFAQGTRDAGSWRCGEGRKRCQALLSRWRKATRLIRHTSEYLAGRQAAGERLAEDEFWFQDNARLLRGLCCDTYDALKSFRGPPVYQTFEGGNLQVPRAYAVAGGFLRAVEFEFQEQALAFYVDGVQQVESLLMGELWALKPMLQFVLLEQVAAGAKEFFLPNEPSRWPEGPADSQKSGPVKQAIQGLHALGEMEWKEFFEQNSATDRVLRDDPAGAYLRMDYESRQIYRDAVEELAPQSLFSEEEVARQAVLVAMRAKTRAQRVDSRKAARRTHVGYYLMDAGKRLLKKRLGYKPSFKNKILDSILEWPEIYFIVGAELTTIALVFFLLWSFGALIPLFPGLLLLIPASHAALGLMNHLTGILVPPRRVPKLDYSQGIPSDCTTLVVVPCLLLNEAEVRKNVGALEIRYLGNRDPNLHFALLTDPPDASLPFDERDELVGLCSKLIEQLNHKYAAHNKGGFFHLHRHRVYNPAEGTWMGWERKRGKLMDLNHLLRGTFDSFPVKVGDGSILRQVRYVITLDSDTQLPRETAHRLIGALAHPLNRAVVNPRTNTVVEGHAILQPRVSVSIESARHSRLASTYSGQTGFDIYTRAVSDVYQDLFGEGSFTGKGIYEVDTFLRVLGKRFPNNALLSHDLIEGAYARAGLVTDIEVVDDYPSHFSAYCRRLHRWVRGDWQIMRWVFPRVPDYYGRRVDNPLTFLSRWKIFDNLRRSLNDAALFLLLVSGWIFLPGGPVYWTLVTLGLLLLPAYSQLIFSLFRLRGVRNWSGFARQRVSDLVTGHLQVFIMLVFLPHQALVMLDAIIRALVRVNITHRRLLEWETAAEAEKGRERTPVETYLILTPWVSLAIGVVLAALRPASVFIASPVLTLWLLADFFTHWVNRRPRDQKNQLNPEDEAFLRSVGLRTWRFFLQYSHAGNHWLIPDNVQEDPPLIASRISPTNLGLLLNAYWAAYQMGCATLDEYVGMAGRTLGAVEQLPRFRGHFFNWYDIQTCQPLQPLFVSTVDSGNLAASLWILKQSCLSIAGEPLLSNKLWQGIRAHARLLAELSQGASVSAEARSEIRDLAACVDSLGDTASAWMDTLPWLDHQVRRIEGALGRGEASDGQNGPGAAQELAWWISETAGRLRSVRELIESFIPWALPEYKSLLQLEEPLEPITLASLAASVREVDNKVARFLDNGNAGESESAAARSLRRRLPASLHNATQLFETVQQLAESADRLVDEMHFGFLYDAKKKVFSIGYDAADARPEAYSYDLLASEARTAVFIAIAKGDVSQESWFRLGRPQAWCHGERALLSWNGTMFEYLMPALWMRSHPGTILDQASRAAVRCQQVYARRHRTPWGISEAAFSKRDRLGSYQYRAFGVPSLALDPRTPRDLVVSPYAAFLALAADPRAAIRNLQAMKNRGWLGALGFYEACDFSSARASENGKHELVRCWMAHHQGMTLLALGNLLSPSSIQNCFHREPRVMATELLLHEKVPLATPLEPSPAAPLEKAGTAAKLRRFFSRFDFPASRRRSRLT